MPKELIGKVCTAFRKCRINDKVSVNGSIVELIDMKDGIAKVRVLGYLADENTDFRPSKPTYEDWRLSDSVCFVSSGELGQLAEYDEGRFKDAAVFWNSDRG